MPLVDKASRKMTLRYGKRKRIVSELDDIENEPGLSSNQLDHQRKKQKDLKEIPVPVSPPMTPTPLSSRNKCKGPENSPPARRCLDLLHSPQHGILPAFNWLNRNGMIDQICEKDYYSGISPDYFKNHPNLQPRMRSVLLDWLLEVSEAYKMQRETYYLSVNYLDRYLSRTNNIMKNHLQLIGITCLFIASKVEEIYPPKANEFAYVTNEACTVDGIMNQELLILDKLEWNLGAFTVNGWLSLLLQLWHNRDAPPKSIIFPNHPVKDYLVTAQLLDLCVLDEGSLRFTYQAMAAAAIYTMTDFKEVVSLPPIESEKQFVMECVRWMSPFVDAIRERSSPRKCYGNGDYTLQTHHVDLQLLENAQQRLRTLMQSSVVMTPPPSSGK